MKYYTIAFILILISLLLYPSPARHYASEGLLLWYKNMIPSLFPFMILSQMMIELNLTNRMTKVLHPVLKSIFHLNTNCDFTIVIGFICGFPLGAYAAFNLYRSGKISDRQLDYLLAFCNNIGPMYLFSCILPYYENNLQIPILIGMYGVPLLYGILLRYTFYRDIELHSDLCVITQAASTPSLLQSFESSVNHAISSIVKLGAYMIFWNTIKMLPLMLFSSYPIMNAFISSLFEINSGMDKVVQLKMPSSLLLLSMLQYGGISCFMQTISIRQNAFFHMKRYLYHKSIQTLIMFTYLLCVVLIFNFFVPK